MDQVNWKARDPKLSYETMFVQLSNASVIGWVEVNYIRNIAMRDETRTGVAFFLDLAGRAKDLNVRMAIVDCIHAIDSSCSRTVLKDELEE